jgi:hypothetical protein
MAKLSTCRARRRSAAEKRVLLPLRRHIGSVDRLSRRKYLLDFSDAYRTYQRVISKQDLFGFCAETDILLLSDFHALDSCQAFLCELLNELARIQQRPLVLLLEAIFTRDQHILDEWQAGGISERELRQRLRFDVEWGYAWEPFVETLKAARRLKIPVYGADCAPRGNMRRITVRDRHAASTVARVRRDHPKALVITMFGESHLAPNHLLQEIRSILPNERIRTVLQNIDALYFRAAGELRQRIEALQVSADVAGVFNATPVEKWQSYRFWISRWRAESPNKIDFAPAIYDLIDALFDFLHIARYGEEDGSPRYVIDFYPEVASVNSFRQAHFLLTRKSLASRLQAQALSNIVEHGSCYIPELNLMIVQKLRMYAAARNVTSFVHHSCRDFRETEIAPSQQDDQEEMLYRRALEDALLDFGARVLYPSHSVSEEEDLFALYAEPREEVEANTLFSYREYICILDCVMLHRDYELHSRSYAVQPPLLRDLLGRPERSLSLIAQYLGRLLGSDLYRAYLAGRFSRCDARSLFMKSLNNGGARELYFTTVRRVRKRRTELAA